MSPRSADVVICGAGILGISVAYQLTLKRGVKNILLIDERPPLTLTSDKSTECYRNWWPGPGDAMVRLMNRSIALTEEMAHQSNNIFKLNHRGYLYVTTDLTRVAALRASAEEASALGAGSLREHASSSNAYAPHNAEGFDGSDGADLLPDAALFQQYFPYLGKDVVAVLHVRRAGWLSAQTYGMWMLEQARAAGVELLSGRITSVETAAGRVAAVTLSDGTQIKTSTFINAAGPHLARVGKLLGTDIPTTNELHLKSSFNDHLGVVGRDAPLVICADEQQLPWNDEERAVLAEDPQTAWLLDTLPSGLTQGPKGMRPRKAFWCCGIFTTSPPFLKTRFTRKSPCAASAASCPACAAISNACRVQQWMAAITRRPSRTARWPARCLWQAPTSSALRPAMASWPPPAWASSSPPMLLAAACRNMPPCSSSLAMRTRFTKRC
jgi:hypothetical protein